MKDGDELACCLQLEQLWVVDKFPVSQMQVLPCLLPVHFLGFLLVHCGHSLLVALVELGLGC